MGWINCSGFSIVHLKGSVEKVGSPPPDQKYTLECKSCLVLMVFMVNCRVQQIKVTMSCIVNVTSGLTSPVRLCPIAADGP